MPYTAHAGENRAKRPPWYSRGLCLRSFLQAFALLKRYVNSRLLVIHDGPVAENRAWAEVLFSEILPGGIVEMEKGGNSQSFLNAVHLACDLSPDSIVSLVEDDYLWTSTSFWNR